MSQDFEAWHCKYESQSGPSLYCPEEGCDMPTGCVREKITVAQLTRVRDELKGCRVRVYFNPFEHSISENNAFLQAGYEVMPIRVPHG